MTDLILPRRKFLAGLAAVIAAPAIVRAGSLMPVRSLIEPIRIKLPNDYTVTSIADYNSFDVVNIDVLYGKINITGSSFGLKIGDRITFS